LHPKADWQNNKYFWASFLICVISWSPSPTTNSKHGVPHRRTTFDASKYIFEISPLQCDENQKKYFNFITM
jgi:hypothetical protein